MSLSKRNSRRISVDGETYRWAPAQNSGTVVLIIQHEKYNGQKIEVTIGKDKNLIIENGFSIECGGVCKSIITPKLVERIIRECILVGWLPSGKESPMKFLLQEEKLEII